MITAPLTVLVLPSPLQVAASFREQIRATRVSHRSLSDVSAPRPPPRNIPFSVTMAVGFECVLTS